MTTPQDQFILAITNEAMDKVCYETTGGTSGWNLRPYQFAISETDILEGYPDSEIFNADGSVKEEIFDILQKLTTQDLKDDKEKIWCELPFSGVTKIGTEEEATPSDARSGMGTLSHHIVIPADLTISGETKEIKTIYYIYVDNRGIPFLYAVARANNYMIYESGLTQKYHFDFTVANAHALNATEFVINYSYPLEIQDHNNSDSAHDDLLKRDGSRTITGLLNYSNGHTPITQGTQLVDKAYIDSVINGKITSMINDLQQKVENEACPPASMIWWPGSASSIPSGWVIRDGRWVTVKDNPKLYGVLGDRYGVKTENNIKYFRIMDDRGVFIRGSETSGNTVVNNNRLSGIGLGALQDAAAPNIRATFGGVNAGYSGATWQSGGRITLSTRNGSNWGSWASFSAERCSTVYKDGVTEVRPVNRNYIPLIRLG